MKILITGSNGLLGQKIVRQLINSQIDFLATSLGANRNSNCPDSNYQSLDITNKSQVLNLVNAFKPTAIINTAAMTNVDACELDEVNCRKINIDAVGCLFDAAKKVNAQFVHLSTDFVFDGENGPYKEEDIRNPLSIYAKSKVDSEDILMNDPTTNWSILRTIIVFGQGENLSRSNIVLWAKAALAKGDPLTIVNDQFRAPTWADDLAWACIQTVKKHATGIFHISGPKTYSIYDLVKSIGTYYGFSTDNVSPINSSTLNQSAKRPPRTGFILSKAQNILEYQPQTLEESLAKLL